MKTNIMQIFRQSWIIFSLVLCFTHSALATLGEHESKIQSKATEQGYSVSDSISHNSGKRYELKLPDSSAEIHEYVSGTTGKVYAIAWSGPTQPDLSELLGDYATEFQNARISTSRAKNVRLPFRRMKSKRLQIHVTKRGKITRGIVYILGAMPTDVTETDLRR